MTNETIIVLVTASSQEEARKIGRALVEQKLAACANLIPSITSIFHWEGRISEENETLVILKTRRALFERLRDTVASLHSYDVPEIIAVSIAEGADSYLRWIASETLSC